MVIRISRGLFVALVLVGACGQKIEGASSKMDPPNLASIADDQVEYAILDYVYARIKGHEEAEVLATMPAGIRALYVTSGVEDEVNNGGFNQYYWNSTGKFADQAVAARPFIHLGATSAFVTDNADLVVMREGLRLVLGRLVALLGALDTFAIRYATVPCLAYTHFQPAQLTTVGKRATLWMQDLVLDLMDLDYRRATLPFRGVKGTTGTQASFLQMFNGDHERVRELDRRVTAAMDFTHSLSVTGQTYTRKLDAQVLGVVSGVATSEILHDGDKAVEVIQALDGRRQHLRELAALSGHVLGKHPSDCGIQFEQPSVEERHGILGNGREGGKALLHQRLLT